MGLVCTDPKKEGKEAKGEKEIKIIIIKWEEQGKKVCKAWRKRETKDWRRENGKVVGKRI